MSSPTTAPEPLVDLTLLLAPMLLGHLLNWTLFGILSIQVYIYYVAFPRDNIKLKVVVGLRMYLKYSSSFCPHAMSFESLPLGWGNPVELGPVGFYWLSLPIMTALLSSVCQVFYAWKIYALSGTYWVAGNICLLSIIQLSVAIWDGLTIRTFGSILDIPTGVGLKFSLAWVASSVLCDLAITCSMFYYLWQAKKSTTIQRTTSLITRLIRLTVETGLIVTTISLVTSILFVTSPKTGFYAVPLLVLSKTYSNCLLAVLNSRSRIAGGRDDTNAIAMHDVSSTHAARSAAGIRSARRSRSDMNGILIEISHITDAQSVHDKEDVGRLSGMS